MSAHFVSTTFGIPSGPGALYGFSLARARLIWSLEIGSALQIGSVLCVGLGASSARGLLGKNALARTLPFSSFVLALHCSPVSANVRSGIRGLPLSPGGAVMYLCAVHKSSSDAFSTQSRQW